MAKRAGTVGSTVGLAGRVKGSDGSYYSVTVDLDVSAGEVLDYSCTCPAAARYPGMCKHEIALALVSLGGVPAGRALSPSRGLHAIPDAPAAPTDHNRMQAAGPRSSGPRARA